MQGFEWVSVCATLYPLPCGKRVRQPGAGQVVVRLAGKGEGLRGESFVALAAAVEG